MTLARAEGRAAFSVSLMCMDLMDAGRQIETLNGLADAYHIDIMDGHFTKNLALSPDFARAVSRYATLPLDIHLMVDTPMDWLEQFAGRPDTTLSVHAETIGNNAFRVLDRVRALGCRTGVAINPATPFEQISAYLNRVDLLTIMTVDVGYSGAPFLPEVLPKIERAAQFKAENGLGYTIQIDGSCNKRSYRSLTQAGAEMFVLGNTGLFGLAEDLGQAWRQLDAEYEAATAVATEGEGAA